MYLLATKGSHSDLFSTEGIVLHDFLVFRSINSDLALDRTDYVSQRISQLHYVIRGVILLELENVEIHKNEYVSSFPRFCLPSSPQSCISNQLNHSNLYRYVENPLKSGTFIGCSPFGSLCLARGLLSRVVHTIKALPRYTWKESAFFGIDYRVAVVKNQDISLEMISTGVDMAIQIAEAKIQLLALGFDFLLPDFADILDDENDSRFGASFISNTNNVDLQDTAKRFSRHVKTHESFFNDKGVFCRDRTVAWLKKAQELVKLLAFVIHVTLGQTGRASEMSDLRFLNDDEIRHLFFHHGNLIMQPAYNKTDRIVQASKRILRFLYHKPARLLTIYLAYIRPVERYSFTPCYY